MKTSNPEVKRIAKLAFPEYRGRKFSVVVTDKPMTFQNYWDGGTRDYLQAVQIDTGKVWPPSVMSQNPYNDKAQLAVAPIPGWALVTHNYFCGQDVGLTVLVHPSNVTPGLPAGETRIEVA